MKIAVMGAGAMGGWFIRSWAGDHEIAVYDLCKDKKKSLRDISARWLNGPADLQDFCPQMLLNAASIGNAVSAFESVLPFVNEDCLLADTASIKGELAEYYNDLPNPFVSVHPMFGPRFGDMEALKNENAIIIAESDPPGKEFFNDFFCRFQINVYAYSFEEHDRLMGKSLALPFTASFLFAAGLNEKEEKKEEKKVPGTSFKAHREMAGKLFQENDDMLTAVMMNPAAIDILDRLSAGLEFLKHVIKSGDREEMTGYIIRLREMVNAV